MRAKGHLRACADRSVALRLRRQKSPLRDQLRPKGNPALVIQVKQRCRASSGWRERLDQRSFETKMRRPAIQAPIEERYDCPILGIDGGDVRPFETIAAKARERKVGEICRPTMLLGDDVVRLLRRQHLIVLNTRNTRTFRPRSATARRSAAGMRVMLMRRWAETNCLR